MFRMNTTTAAAGQPLVNQLLPQGGVATGSVRGKVRLPSRTRRSRRVSRTRPLTGLEQLELDLAAGLAASHGRPFLSRAAHR
jgi:hypothetical protein